MFFCTVVSGLAGICAAAEPAEPRKTAAALDLPDAEIVAAFQRAATQNVLAAVNPKVFYGYWSVCADGKGFGYGYTYPSLDGHQMTDALLFLGQVDVVKANWDYVRKFQRPNGQLPLAILPELAGKMIGPRADPIASGRQRRPLRHWVPGDPLARWPARRTSRTPTPSIDTRKIARGCSANCPPSISRRTFWPR